MRAVKTLSAGLAIVAGATMAGANADVRFISGPPSGCSVKGIIKAQYVVPERGIAIIVAPRDSTIGILDAGVAGGALANLKRQAAGLGANRIIVRSIPAAGSLTMGSRGSSADWTGGEIIAEAYRC